MRSEDRIGQKIRDWTIISIASKVLQPKFILKYNYQCKCGNIKTFEKYYMDKSGPKCCISCKQKERTQQENYIGNNIGNWTITKELYDTNPIKGSRYWLGRCKCGKTRKFNYTDLNSTTSYIKRLPKNKCLKCLREERRQPKKFLKVMPDMRWNIFLQQNKYRKIEINITKTYVKKLFKQQNGLCALSKIPIYFCSSRQKNMLQFNTASLDRIDSSKGYIKGNVQWVHKWVNNMKLDFSMQEFIQFCKQIAEHN